MELALYFGLLAALFVRVRARGEQVVPRSFPVTAQADELRLVRLHHALFYLLLVASFVEYLMTGNPGSVEELAGVVLFALGLVFYRLAGRILGPALSPLISPASVSFCQQGVYTLVRHPMYLGQLLMSFGAPLVLGSHISLLLSVPIALVLFMRMSWEERLWIEDCPDYLDYQQRVPRLIPFVC